MSPGLRCILFDLYETLVTFDATIVRNARQRVLGPYGVPVTRYEVADIGTLGERMLGRCGDTLIEETALVLREAGAPTNVAFVNEFLEAELAAWRAATIVPEDVMPCLWMLRCGFELGLVSNCVGLTPALLPDWPFGELFDFTVLSCREGVLKPEREIFDIAIERAGCAPDEVALVDDKRSNVEAALDSGMRGWRVARDGFHAGDPPALVDLGELACGLVAQARQR